MASKAILGSLVRSPSNRFLRVGVRWLSSSQSSSAVDEMDKVIERIKRLDKKIDDIDAKIEDIVKVPSFKVPSFKDSKMDDKDRLIKELLGKMRVMERKIGNIHKFVIGLTIINTLSSVLGERRHSKISEWFPKKA